MTHHARLAVEEYVERWGEPGGSKGGFRYKRSSKGLITPWAPRFNTWV